MEWMMGGRKRREGRGGEEERREGRKGRQYVFTVYIYIAALEREPGIH